MKLKQEEATNRGLFYHTSAFVRCPLGFRPIKNIKILQNILGNLSDKIVAGIEKSTDGGLKLEVEKFRKLYEQIQGEQKKQLVMLQNLTTTTIMPNSNEILSIMEDQSKILKVLMTRLKTQESLLKKLLTCFLVLITSFTALIS